MPKSPLVMVVGGGIIGLACAHYLAAQGRRVLIIEQGQVGSGASHGNCGLLFFSHLMPLCSPGVIWRECRRMFHAGSPLYISPRPDWRRLTWLLRFAAHCTHTHLEAVMRARAGILAASARLYDELFASLDLPCDRHRKGVLLVYRSRAEWAAYSATNSRLKRFGHGARPVSAQELARLEPALAPQLAGGWYHPHDSHLRPDFLLQSWKKALVDRGVDIVENCRLEGICRRRGAVDKVLTSAGVFRPGALVLAAGAWTGSMAARLGIGLPLEAGKGYSLTMARPETGPTIPCYFHDRGVVATPWDSGLRIGGTMEFSGLNTTMAARRLENLRQAANSYLRVGPAGAAAQAWVGLRPVMADDLPVIDRVPGAANLVIAAGHGMMGLSMATATGRIVADMVAGRTPAVAAAAFGLRRFGRWPVRRKTTAGGGPETLFAG
jgi:D-amino-acid dehydrogenase